MLYTPTTQVVNNACVRHVDFEEALTNYKMGKTIECRIVNKYGEIIGWEKYHHSEGLEIALEFNEILNGMWFVVEHEV